MKRITLIATHCDVTGELGLMVDGLSVPDGEAFAAMSGLLIAHDLLEHQNGVEQIGTIDDELEALGGVWFVRGQFGDLSRDGAGSLYSTEQNVSGDVTRMFRDHWEGGAYVAPTVPRTRAHDEDDSFDCILDYAREDIPKELEPCNTLTDQNERDAAVAHYLKIAKARLRIGFRKAAKKWTRAQNANAQFWAIARAVDPFARHVEHEGQRFTLSYGNGEARCVEDFGDDYE